MFYDGGHRPLEEIFHSLWGEFSRYGYGHGYDTAESREKLILILSTNNVFELVQDERWISFMKNYFETDVHPWSRRPLKEVYKPILKILYSNTEAASGDDPVLQGRLDCDEDNFGMEDISSDLYYIHAKPSRKEFLTSPPAELFYGLPYHLMRVDGKSLMSLVNQPLKPFDRLALHFTLSLILRTVIVRQMGISRTFTYQQAARQCEMSIYDVKMVIGQMIKVGLADFDRNRLVAWNDDTQELICLESAKVFV